jgi:hypothetical protein
MWIQQPRTYASCIDGRNCCRLCRSDDTRKGVVAASPTVVGAWSSNISIDTWTNPRVEKSIARNSLTFTRFVDVACICRSVGHWHLYKNRHSNGWINFASQHLVRISVMAWYRARPGLVMLTAAILLTLATGTYAHL